MKSLREFFSSLYRPATGNLPRIVILISGRGSNMRALLEKIREGRLRAQCTLVLSDREAKGLEVARAMGFRAELFPKKKEESRESFDRRLAERVKKENPALVVCAGYLRILSEPMLTAFPQRIINIHPSLLPAFPGLRSQKQALDYGVKVTGCTIHLVDAGVDTGRILAQGVVPVLAKDSEETLSRRILKAEHDLYWRTVQKHLERSAKKAS
ncbi:MAG TPA: phosphoribosylglycinamide formyltransferase [Turneriella sp.]|nr:phosphoribosylglycinamide formyltransferase [Turneriella sp.]